MPRSDREDEINPIKRGLVLCLEHQRITPYTNLSMLKRYLSSDRRIPQEKMAFREGAKSNRVESSPLLSNLSVHGALIRSFSPSDVLGCTAIRSWSRPLRWRQAPRIQRGAYRICGRGVRTFVVRGPRSAMSCCEVASSTNTPMTYCGAIPGRLPSYGLRTASRMRVSSRLITRRAYRAICRELQAGSAVARSGSLHAAVLGHEGKAANLSCI